MNDLNIGFMGAGGIARAHAYALNALKYYYPIVPEIRFEAVTSIRKESREKFAHQYGFHKAMDLENFVKNDQIDVVLILGPNQVHVDHLKLALQMPRVKQIYLEKPVCASKEEEIKLHEIAKRLADDISIQVGFQYLQTSSVREALQFWESGILGSPIHFDLKYYHGDYLQSSYREKRKTRLTPAPDGGAMADLGSHGISLLMAFLSEKLELLYAIQGGAYDDVPEGSDLFSSISLFDPNTQAVGSLSASRISSGTGDLIYYELYAEKGSLRYSSHQADCFEYYLEKDQQWVKKVVGSHYKPISSFPSGHVPAGWLRAMVHAHHIFLTGDANRSFVPDLNHGLAVQRVVRETAEHLRNFRNSIL